MTAEQISHRGDLKPLDIADQLGTNRSYLSNAIKAVYGLSFTQLINTYRVSYAMNELRDNPDKKMYNISAEAT